MEDYQFNDNSSESKSGPFGGGMKQTVTANTPSNSGSGNGSSQKSPFEANRDGDSSSRTVNDPAPKLKVLKDLKESGVLTEEEYQAKRKIIIDKL